MTAEVENLILEHLREVREAIAATRDVVQTIRVGRIERRLDLVDVAG